MDKVDQTCTTRRIVTGAGTAACAAAGWLAALVSLVRFPFIFGVIAMILGIRISKSGSRAGMPLVAASILLMAVGLMFNSIIYDYLKNVVGI